MFNELTAHLLEKDRYFLISQLIITLSVVVLFTSILLDFAMFQEKNNTTKEKKSIVETGTMTLFLLVFLTVLKYTMKYTLAIPLEYRRIFAIVGSIIVFAGAVLNVIGRFYLGGNWANHIKIYKDHKLVNKGLYKVVRHPLYSSIMVMFIGGCISYLNIYTFILEITVFVPFMYYRAKQEEKLLSQRFPEYTNYKKSTGMFLPKIIKRR